MSIIINIDKAKEIWRNHWREARKPLLEQLDIEFMQAVEAGDTAKQSAISAKKQLLRDVTKTSLPNSPEAIKQVWPEVLK